MATQTEIKTLLNGKALTYQVRVSPRARRLRITISESGVTVTLPRGFSGRDAETFLQQNAEWVDRQLARQQRSRKRAAQPALPRDVILLRGVPTQITTIVDPGRKSRAALENTGGRLKVHLPSGTEKLRGQVVEKGLRSMARAEIEREVAEQAQRMHLFPASVTIRDQRTRWGSCSTSGTLSFNWRLVMAPPEILSYVVIHELSHMREPNHSPAFWKVVAQYYPNYREARAWLKKNAALLRPRL